MPLMPRQAGDVAKRSGAGFGHAFRRSAETSSGGDAAKDGTAVPCTFPRPSILAACSQNLVIARQNVSNRRMVPPVFLIEFAKARRLGAILRVPEEIGPNGAVKRGNPFEYP